MNQAMSVIQKAAMTSVITATASSITTGYRWKAAIPSIFGLTRSFQCPLWVFAGLSGAIASLVNDGIHKLIKDEVHISKKAQDDASLYLGAIFGAVSYYGIVFALNPYLARDIGTWTLLGTGAASESLSNFLFDMVLN